MTTLGRHTRNLAQTVEFVAAVALGLGFSWVAYRSNPFMQQPELIDYVILVGAPFLCGVGFAGGVGLAIETLRGRSPERWGVGRWAWAIAMLYTIALMTGELLVVVPVRPDPFRLTMSVRSAWEDLSSFLISLWIISQYTARPRPRGADVREWLGRAFGLSVLIRDAFEISSTFWYRP